MIISVQVISRISINYNWVCVYPDFHYLRYLCSAPATPKLPTIVTLFSPASRFDLVKIDLVT